MLITKSVVRSAHAATDLPLLLIDEFAPAKG